MTYEHPPHPLLRYPKKDVTCLAQSPLPPPPPPPMPILCPSLSRRSIPFEAGDGVRAAVHEDPGAAVNLQHLSKASVLPATGNVHIQRVIAQAQTDLEVLCALVPTLSPMHSPL